MIINEEGMNTIRKIAEENNDRNLLYLFSRNKNNLVIKELMIRGLAVTKNKTLLNTLEIPEDIKRV
jgi:hypothetical protein